MWSLAWDVLGETSQRDVMVKSTEGEVSGPPV